MEHAITLQVNPAALSTAQQKGVDFSRKRVFTKASVLRSHRMIREALADVPQCATVRVEGAVELLLRFVYPLGSKPRRFAYQPKVTRPDLDNLAKAVVDAIAEDGRFFADDAQVVRLTLEKFYGGSNVTGCIDVEWGALGWHAGSR